MPAPIAVTVAYFCSHGGRPARLVGGMPMFFRDGSVMVVAEWHAIGRGRGHGRACHWTALLGPQNPRTNTHPR